MAGAALPLAFAPYGWWWIAVAVYAGLLWALADCQRVLHTGATTLVFFVCVQVSGHSWIWQALSAEVGWPDAVAWTVMALLALYLAAPVAASMALWDALYHWRLKRWFHRHVWLSSAPFFLMIGEFARSASFGGFSSLYPGYAMVDAPLAGFLPLGGVWLAGWLALLSAYLVFLLAHRQAAVHVGAKWLLTALCAGLWVLGVILGPKEWVEVAGDSRRVSIVQTDVRQSDKFDEAKLNAVWSQLQQLIERADSALIFTPETAVPVFMADVPFNVMQAWRSVLAQREARLYLGAPLQAGGDTHNAIVEMGAMGPSGKVYVKSVLMPFGEYTPTGFEWLSPLLDIPLKNLVPQHQLQQPFRVDQWATLGGLICQEDLDGEVASHRARAASILFNPTNLAWFGGRAGHQRLQIARTRAIEVGRPVIRAANRDGSALIDHKGRVSAPSGPGATVIEASVQPMKGSTPYTSLGWVWLLVLVAFSQALITSCFKIIAGPPPKEGARS